MSDFTYFTTMIRHLRLNSNEAESLSFTFDSIYEYIAKDNNNNNSGDECMFHFYVGALSESMYMNPVVKKVIISYDFLEQLASDYIKYLLFASIGSLPNLEYLEIDCRGYRNNEVLIQWLRKALGANYYVSRRFYNNNNNNNNSSSSNYKINNHLLDLKLVWCNFVETSDDDFISLLSAIQSCTSLKRIRLNKVTFPIEVDLNCFIRTISEMTSLEDIELDDRINNHGMLSAEQTLSTLLLQGKLPVLKFLKLRSMNLDSNSSSSGDGNHLLLPLQHNNNHNLVTLSCERIKCLDLYKNPIGDDIGVHLVKLLLNEKQSSTLEKINLSNCNIGDRTCVALADALKTNRVLTMLYLTYNNDITKIGYDALSDAVQDNMIIKGLHLMSGRGQQQRRLRKSRKQQQERQGEEEDDEEETVSMSRINFYLDLNKHGRYSLLGNTNNNISRYEYLDSVVNLAQKKYYINEEDINFCCSAIYYYIRAEPLLLSA